MSELNKDPLEDENPEFQEDENPEFPDDEEPGTQETQEEEKHPIGKWWNPTPEEQNVEHPIGTSH